MRISLKARWMGERCMLRWAVLECTIPCWNRNVVGPLSSSLWVILSSNQDSHPFAMTSRSEDEWSLVSNDEEVLSDTSYDEVEVEPEVTETLAACGDKAEVSANAEDIADVLSLLADTSVSERSTAGDIRVSLLSPAHQNRFVSAPPQYSRKKTVKLAFVDPDTRPRSFPERLRAITVAMRPLPEEVEHPTFTEVVPVKRDQSTQANFGCDTASEAHEARAVLLRAALDRSVTLANKLRSKSQDNERLWFRIADLERAAVQTEQKAQRDAMKIRFNERSIALAKQQTKLTVEYQHNLKTIVEDLRRENTRLEARNAALRGEDKALAIRSVDELEELENELARGMDRVRVALRAKYRAALEKRREKELCVVCFAQPVSVVLLPCRHQVLCASCSVRMTTCPIDRKDIQDKVLTYGLSAYKDNGGAR